MSTISTISGNRFRMMFIRMILDVEVAVGPRGLRGIRSPAAYSTKAFEEVVQLLCKTFKEQVFGTSLKAS
ncbi:hypothetical protein PsorP6_006056 [Peronosclerospora sorghi]|uniref:Uncharacterized protein n=1 Tax=Peronosclerospora sorghi TaxID=230839 RepID=A0ACC0W786_9STRA|nr:hypothetical protein PsorP6_006056 [Peronosclerospora sorghi]